MSSIITLQWRLLALILALCFVPATAVAAGVHPRFDLTCPRGGPFPSDRFTVFDPEQATLRRVTLPKPDCTTRPSDCADIDVINSLDGFNLQPRLSIPFDGAIDVASVGSGSVFLLRLASIAPRANPGSTRVGINQVVWDPATMTLFAESDELLDEDAVYGLVVTRAVRDTAGDPIEGSKAFQRFRHELNFGQTHDPILKEYRDALLLVLAKARHAGVPEEHIAVASVFTTQSATAVLQKIQRQIKGQPVPVVDFDLGPGGARTVFPMATLTGLMFNRQVTTAPGFTATPVPVALVGVIPGAVGTLAFGRFLSPDYETAEKFIPPVGTLVGEPVVQATVPVYFNLFLPAGTPPPGGWPVALFGHAFTLDKNSGLGPFAVAATLAANGIATATINVVGHGGGPLGTLTAFAAGASVTFPAGGRGIDQDGNGSIDASEGLGAAPPRRIIGNRDGVRQTVIDLMALVRAIGGGVDVDGNGSADLDPARVYYFGQSLSGMYGTALLAVDPDIRAGVLNVAGGSMVELLRLGSFRPLLGQTLATRVPSLINVTGITFNENLPLRNQPALVNDVAGAIEIQDYIDNTEWVQQAANAVAYAPHIRKDPFGTGPKPVIFQFAKGDQNVPNPTTTAILRAGDLADTATYFRNDLAFVADPAVLKNPHLFLTRITTPSVAAVAFAAQQQIARFFASDGTVVIDPYGAGAVFEVPIIPPLPEELNFIP